MIKELLGIAWWLACVYFLLTNVILGMAIMFIGFTIYFGYLIWGNMHGSNATGYN